MSKHPTEEEVTRCAQYLEHGAYFAYLADGTRDVLTREDIVHAVLFGYYSEGLDLALNLPAPLS